MKSIMFDEYEATAPRKHPTTGDVVLMFECGEEKYIFPMKADEAEVYWNLLGETLGKKGETFKPASVEEMRRATRTR
jgi:hypothetical protein